MVLKVLLGIKQVRMRRCALRFLQVHMLRGKLHTVQFEFFATQKLFSVLSCDSFFLMTTTSTHILKKTNYQISMITATSDVL